MNQSNDPHPKLHLPSSKKLKVYYAYRGNGFKNRYPVIRFGGNYLNSIGFKIDTQFLMELSADKIILTRIALS
jgi:hypothetical protein